MSDKDDELSRHIGTLWRTAMAGLDTTREVVMRSMQTGRLRVDIALLQKERSQLLETLGEMVMRLVDEGGFNDAPQSVRQTCDRIKDVDGRLKNDSIRAHDNAFGAPRGYEPEAATDYGNDFGEGDETDADPAAPVIHVAAPKSGRAAGKPRKPRQAAQVADKSVAKRSRASR